MVCGCVGVDVIVCVFAVAFDVLSVVFVVCVGYWLLRVVCCGLSVVCCASCVVRCALFDV